MCGIVGYIGKKNALTAVVSGLEKLEYRGYDSAGVSFLINADVKTFRAQGKLVNLKDLLGDLLLGSNSNIAIGHTRWATHGKPSEVNAHPHTVGRVSLVHNGIIENYLSLKKDLQARGRNILSQTDSEIAAHLLDEMLQVGKSLSDAMFELTSVIRGSFAFLALDSLEPNKLIISRQQSPIVIGLGEDFSIVASDIPALLEYTRRVVFLEEGDIAEVEAGKLKIKNAGVEVFRKEQVSTLDAVSAQRGGFKHFMLKEISEQPQVVADSFAGKFDLASDNLFSPDFLSQKIDPKKIDRIIMLACGTSYYACLLAKHYFENIAGLPCEIEFASEFRYKKSLFLENVAVLAVSQSGETADTLAAIKHVAAKVPTFAVSNVLGSSLARAVDQVFFIQAGPEISVASTKAFSTQLVNLYLVAVQFALKRNKISKEQAGEYCEKLLHLPNLISKVLEEKNKIEELAKKISDVTNCLFIGRGISFPIVLEGALKLKELSYIHAEAFPAGELKHGPLALIEKGLPVIVVLPRDITMFEKTFSNLQEVKARDGFVIAITDASSEDVLLLKSAADVVIEVPYLSEYLSPLLSVIPLQLLAYYVALHKGTDVDQPRNLAKSVTVE